MPLRKLWNSILGKSAEKVGEADSRQQAVSPGAEPDEAAKTREKKPLRSGAASATREEKKLIRQIESLGVQSLLEITVGDGRRSLAMLQKLTHKGHSIPIHYIAVDEFEMGGGPLTLRQFHKQLREFPAKAQLVPMSIDAGLDRVVRTYGQVDLILWSSQRPPTLAQRDALARLSKPTTALFVCEEGRWVHHQETDPAARRAA